MQNFRKFFVENIFLLITISFAFIASFSLFHSGLPPTHDGEYHVVRFYEFDKVLRDGNLYPRWAPDLNKGFGIPLFNFVYPLSNYVAFIFHSFGLSFIDSFKANLFLATILGALFFYLWAKEFWGRLGGLVGSVFYTFSPYHFLDIYIRGSVGEVWALSLFPGFLWAFTMFIKEKNKKFLIFSSIFLALIVFSHNILALMFFFFSIFYILFLILKSKGKKFLIINSSIVVLLGFGLSSIFWAPALFERQFARGLEVFDYSRHFPDIYELLIPSWGSGFSQGVLSNKLSFQIGIANLLAVISSVGLLFLKRTKKEKRILLFFLLSFALVLFLMLRASMSIWEKVPFMNYFQFPWRFLSLEIIFASFLAGSLVYFSKSKFFGIFMIVFVFLLGIGYTKVPYYHQRSDSYYTTRSNFIDGTNSPGNAFNTIWMKDLKKQKEKLVFLNGSGSIEKIEAKSTQYIFRIDADDKSVIRVNTAFFPGWTVYVNERKVETRITNEGLFSFPIEREKSEIKVKFEDTVVRRMSTILTLFSLVFLALTSSNIFVKIKG